jgi:hypothetical protein
MVWATSQPSSMTKEGPRRRGRECAHCRPSLPGTRTAPRPAGWRTWPAHQEAPRPATGQVRALRVAAEDAASLQDDAVRRDVAHDVVLEPMLTDQPSWSANTSSAEPLRRSSTWPSLFAPTSRGWRSRALTPRRDSAAARVDRPPTPDRQALSGETSCRTRPSGSRNVITSEASGQYVELPGDSRHTINTAVTSRNTARQAAENRC